MLSHPVSAGVCRVRRTIDHDQPATGNQRLPHLSEDGLRIIQFMISVRNEDLIHSSRRQMRIGRSPMYDGDVALILQDRPKP